mmetsp:Transcript_19617/g.42595  ORF Transcript_19617/g.42595 Transcript_19617/m.42595 type:complete len:102 (+) Transcript_19617:1564-1869(+)
MRKRRSASTPRSSVAPVQSTSSPLPPKTQTGGSTRGRHAELIEMHKRKNRSASTPRPRMVQKDQISDEQGTDSSVCGSIDAKPSNREKLDKIKQRQLDRGS